MRYQCLQALTLVLDRLLGIFRKPAERRPEFSLFRDGMGNFELFYPKGWKFDRDIAVVDGKYTISFQSPDGLSQFTVAADLSIRPGFSFPKYARAELESPSSGIYATPEKCRFRGMPAYSREYSYSSGGRRFFGGGMMFYTGQAVFSLSWGAPEAKKGELMPAFAHMLDTLAIREGPAIRRRKRAVRGKPAEMAVLETVREA